MRVAVIGASPKEDRFSNKAMVLLAEKGHDPVPVAPGRVEILGRKSYPDLNSVPGQIDTVTVYVGAERQEQAICEIIAARPERVIFNPGAENPAVYDRLKAAGIAVVEACTLVLLRTGQF